MFLPPSSHHDEPEQSYSPITIPDALSVIDGLHSLSSKGFFVSVGILLVFAARLIPDAWIIVAAIALITVIFFWIQKPSLATQKMIADRRITGCVILLACILANWDALFLLASRPIGFFGVFMKLWQWLSFGTLFLVVGLMMLVVANTPENKPRSF
jgi:hypothetical protein